MANFVSLPIEIVEEVTDYLSPEDFLHLRVTCRAIADKTFRLFQADYFNTRAVMLEQLSMQNLVDISRHPILRQAVEQVELCVDHLIEPDTYKRRVSNAGDQRWENIGKLYRESWKDMTDQFNHRICTAQLAKALSRFPNCKAVGVGNTYKPWGAVKLARRIGTFPNQDDTWPPIPDPKISYERPKSKIHALRCIRALISAVCWSRLDVREIYITLGSDDEEDPDCAIPLMLILPTWLEVAAKQRLATVKTLSILIGSKAEDNDIRQSRELASNDPVRKRPRRWHADFQQFLNMFSSLSELTITAGLSSQLPNHPSPNTWFQAPHLRALTLIGVKCTTIEMLQLLQLHKNTLLELSLRRVGLSYFNDEEYQVPDMLFIQCNWERTEDSDALAESPDLSCAARPFSLETLAVGRSYAVLEFSTDSVGALPWNPANVRQGLGSSLLKSMHRTMIRCSGPTPELPRSGSH
ncbi:hypothetical protein CKAH01_12252 [Colletotrichum kahawae]|uniref:F-box domain-containing protein n=1 Tax=Colletotrichum kahawae TaxID=34407 RepID=A0AAD9YV08_COLKA|nr:hypothetical protein CKAH01_12252 [Colletotrichum kahawae]